MSWRVAKQCHGGRRYKNMKVVDLNRHDGLSLRGDPTEEAPDALVVSLITEDAGLLIRLRSRSTSRSRLDTS